MQMQIQYSQTDIQGSPVTVATNQMVCGKKDSW